MLLCGTFVRFRSWFNRSRSKCRIYKQFFCEFAVAVAKFSLSSVRNVALNYCSLCLSHTPTMQSFVRLWYSLFSLCFCNLDPFLFPWFHVHTIHCFPVFPYFHCDVYISLFDTLGIFLKILKFRSRFFAFQWVVAVAVCSETRMLFPLFIVLHQTVNLATTTNRWIERNSRHEVLESYEFESSLVLLIPQFISNSAGEPTVIGDLSDGFFLVWGWSIPLVIHMATINDISRQRQFRNLSS